MEALFVKVRQKVDKSCVECKATDLEVGRLSDGFKVIEETMTINPL